MAAFGYRNTDVTFKVTGTSAIVPDNCFARLMYYLNCIDSCVPNVIPSNLTNYRQYLSLSEDNKRLLVSLVTQLSPDVLDDTIFHHVESLPDSNNEFVEISVAQNTIAGVAASNGTVLIGGRRVNVSKIMLYKSIWIRNNYTSPLAAATNQLNSMRRAISTVYLVSDSSYGAGAGAGGGRGRRSKSKCIVM